jgi:hypothetical protein
LAISSFVTGMANSSASVRQARSYGLVAVFMAILSMTLEDTHHGTV